MSSAETNSSSYARVAEPTLAYVWHSVSGQPIADDLLDWPPDVFAFTNVILERSYAIRFALPPSNDWPPPRKASWTAAVVEAGSQWGAWTESRRGHIPDLVREQWTAIRPGAGNPIDEVASGRDRRLCEALLTLHAIADEACAGLGIALDSADGHACAYRARGRELLARAGTLSRIDPRFLRVLPKVSTPPTGRAAYSRYACVHGPGIDARWRKMPARHRGIDVTSEFATLLLLPWPLQVHASDFRPVEDSVQRLEKDPFGFFEFAPAEQLDLDLLDRVLVAAREEVASIDVVLLPEAAVDENDIEALESLLHFHGAISLIAGIRRPARQPGRLGGNWIHLGYNPRFEKGAGMLPDPDALSLAERVQAIVDAPVAAGLHSIAASNLGSEPPDEDVLVCGDDAAAKELALGFCGRLVAGRALDAGPLANARTLEGLTAVIVNLNRRYKAHAGVRISGLEP